MEWCMLGQGGGMELFVRAVLFLGRGSKILQGSAVLIAICLSASAGQSVTLGWKPSPDTNAVGYAIYFGTASGSYTSRLDAGAKTTYTVTNLVEGIDYFFVTKAYDANGMESPPSNEVSFIVPDMTSPSVQVTAPAPSSTIAGAISVNVSASDTVGITKVEWYLDGTLMSSSTSASASFPWDTTKSPNGTHTIQARAYDPAANVGSSAPVTVTVQNIVADTIPPAVQLASPAPSSTVSGTVSVNVTASDNVGVTKVEWYLDGNLKGSSSGSSLSFPWDTTKSANGSHTIQAKAIDAAGNVGATILTTVTVQN